MIKMNSIREVLLVSQNGDFQLLYSCRNINQDSQMLLVRDASPGTE